ncbi:MAG TPA: Ada metal-binding domain-containing protein, partial [Thermoanaerobaculia bacterium]|nr:Ada metal-binding domain-containing protein [Thermoanaerobaculia bacterium]
YRAHAECLPGVNAAPAAAYTGNVQTHKFHRRSCRYFTCARCTRTFATRDEAIAAGYDPCRVCDP